MEASEPRPPRRPTTGYRRAKVDLSVCAESQRWFGAVRGDSSRERSVTLQFETPAVGRAYADLLVRQVQGIDAWSRHRRDRQQALAVSGPFGEDRLDGARAREALDRTHASLVAHLDHVLAAEADAPMPSHCRDRAVLVHRHEWFVEKMTEALSRLGIVVVAGCDNGADAIGILIAEQPELALVQESLPMVSGEGVLRQVKQFCPSTAVAAQVASGARIGAFLDVGARIAVTRQVPPVALAAQMSDLLRHPD